MFFGILFAFSNLFFAQLIISILLFVLYSKNWKEM